MDAQATQLEPPVNRLRIGELARAGEASTKTIRYYEQVGLLPPAQRAENGYRFYGTEDVRRLRFLRNARSLDYSLDDLKEVLALRDRDEAPCRYVMRLLEEKSAEIEERIHRLRELQQDLQQLVEQAATLPDDDIDMKACVCHLIYNR
jgi:DNA-binding transcriptional MerR regulator